MYSQIIGIVGAKGCGKSTLGSWLATEHHFKHLPLAKPIKDMLTFIGLTEDHLNGHLKEAPCHLLAGKTPRHAMQTLGTEWGRKLISENIWLNLWRQQAASHPKIVCDDVRFANEVQAIKDMGGTIIRVRRPNGSEGSSNHESELYFSTLKADIEIVNDKDIPHLLKQFSDQYFPYIKQKQKQPKAG